MNPDLRERADKLWNRLADSQNSPEEEQKIIENVLRKVRDETIWQAAKACEDNHCGDSDWDGTCDSCAEKIRKLKEVKPE